VGPDSRNGVRYPLKSNAYENILEGTWEVFGGYLDGAREALICVVSAAPLGEPAHAALQSSFARLGYGTTAGTFLSLSGTEPGDGVPPLGEKEVFTVLEGLDPLMLLVTDAEAGAACSRAYGQELPLDRRSRLFGREARAFSSFGAMLDSPKGKQAAWALLKSLPKAVS